MAVQLAMRAAAGPFFVVVGVVVEGKLVAS
jgi:hypothetical protein